LIASSRGVVTALSTALAFAPMYVDVTATSGGATLGYCAMGRVGIATRPAMSTTAEATPAKTGRWRKNRVIKSPDRQ
jgi:hypothetical protein